MRVLVVPHPHQPSVWSVFLMLVICMIWYKDSRFCFLPLKSVMCCSCRQTPWLILVLDFVFPLEGSSWNLHSVLLEFQPMFTRGLTTISPVDMLFRCLGYSYIFVLSPSWLLILSFSPYFPAVIIAATDCIISLPQSLMVSEEESKLVVFYILLRVYHW